MSKIYVNKKLKMMRSTEMLYSAYVGNSTVFLDVDTIKCLKLISNEGIEWEDFAIAIRNIYPDIQVENVIERLIKQNILVKELPQLKWNSNTYGISKLDDCVINEVVNTLKSKRLYRYEYLTLESMKWQEYSPCEKLENEIERLIGMKYCVVMNSGTSALECAFNILSIGTDDEVICPVYNYIGSASSMMHNGAKPVLCDIDDTYMLCPEEIEKKISANTKAILCTHLQGKAAEIYKLKEITRKYNLYLIEDCAQSIGAEMDGKKLGSFGDIACFSFQQNKVISAGEGGAIVMNEKILYEKAIQFSDASRAYMYKDHIQKIPSHNMRMPEINAVIIIEQIKKLDTYSQHLQKLYSIFEKRLCQISAIKLQRVCNTEGCVPQSVYIKCKTPEDAQELQEHLNSYGVSSRKLYCEDEINTDIFLWWPAIVNEQEQDEIRKKFQKSLELLQSTVSFALGLDISSDDVNAVCEKIEKYYK